MMKTVATLLTGGLAAAALAFFAANAQAQDLDIDLPGSMTWTCWSQGTGSYNLAVSIGTTVKEKLGTNIQFIPAQTDLARQLPLKQGRVNFSCSGGGSYLSQEGLADFAVPEWGPQPVRLMALNVAPIHAAILVGADTGVTEVAGLKGKRVASVLGTPSLNQLMEANLAFGGLTWDDVEKVEVPGFMAAVNALMEDRVDAIILSSSTGQATQVEASQRGAHYLPFPASDKEGWARLKKIAPYALPISQPIGAMIPEGFEGLALPLPFMITYDDAETDLVYNMTKALFELHDDYAASLAKGFDGMALEDQVLEFIMPYHEGAIRYFKEEGVWTDEHQAHNDMLIKRQNVLKAAWDQYLTSDPAEADFAEGWAAARKAALQAANL